MLNVVDEFTRECLAIRVGRKKAADVIALLADLFITPGTPEHIRSDNGAGVRGQGGPGLDRGGRS